MTDSNAAAASIPVHETSSFEKSAAQETKSTSTSTSVASVSIEKTEDPSATKSNAVENAGEAPPANADDENDSHYPIGFKLVTLIIALCLAVFLVALDQTIIATVS
jgi:hypothetical protein